MRPRLLDDVRFVETPQGTHARSSHSSCLLSGAGAHQWVRRLAPLLTGEHTVEDLTAGLSQGHKEMVEGLVETLAEYRFVVDARADRPHGLSTAEEREYADEIAFIRYAYDSPQWRFQQVREARVLLWGDGPLLPAILEAGLDSGWRQVSVATAGPLPESVVGARRDPAQTVHRCEWEPVVPRGAMESADLLVHVSRLHDSTDRESVLRRAAEAGLPVVEAVTVDDGAWLTPVVRDHALLMSTWRRLAATWVAREGSDERSWLAGAVPSMIGSALVLSAFRYLARMRVERMGKVSEARRPRVSHVDFRSLSTSSHAMGVHADPVSAVGASPDNAAAAAAMSAVAEPADEASLAGAAALLVDPWLGPLASLGEEDLPQAPLPMCRATVSDMGDRVLGAPLEVAYGWGATPQQARARTLLSAAALYAAAVDRGGAAAVGAKGIDVATGQTRALPPPTADRPGNRTDTDTAELCAYAAGLSWDDAVTAALQSHCEELLGGMMPSGAPSGPAAADEESELADLMALLRAARPDAAVFEHAPVLGLHACTVRVEGSPLARAVAADPAEATRGAVERALASVQLAAAGHRWPSPARHWVDMDVPAETRRRDLARFADGLHRATGARAVAIPVQLPLGTPLPLSVVKVVLCHG